MQQAADDRSEEPPRSEDEQLDHALVARLRVGEVAAFSELLRRYWAQLVAYAARMLGTRDAAEDAVQETFVRIWERRATLKPGTSPRGYLYRLTRNLVFDELRRRRVRTRRATLTADAPAAPPTPAQIAEADALESAVARAIDVLAERRREVFVLAHFHGLSYRQIAEVLGIAPQTVANHMSLALQDLRRVLRPYLDRGPH